MIFNYVHSMLTENVTNYNDIVIESFQHILDMQVVNGSDFAKVKDVVTGVALKHEGKNISTIAVSVAGSTNGISKRDQTWLTKDWV